MIFPAKQGMWRSGSSQIAISVIMISLIMISLMVAISASAPAQDAGTNRAGVTSAEMMAADQRISTALQQVSAERIRANIEQLVSFGTRSTISAQDPAAIAGGAE